MFYLSKTVFKSLIIILAFLVPVLNAAEVRDTREIRGKIVIKEADMIQLEIQKHKESVSSFAAEETRIFNRLNHVEQSINQTGKRVATLGAKLSALEKQIGSATAGSNAAAENIKARQAYAARRLVAYYKMNNLGRIQMLASAESVNEFLFRKKALERILSHDETAWKQLVDTRAELQQQLENLKRDQKDLRSFKDDYSRQLQILGDERRNRSELLANIRNKKSLEMAALEALTKAAALLDQTVRDGIKDAYLPESRTDPRPFASFKGGMMMPVKGKIVSLFGTYRTTKFNVKIFRSGIDIQAEYGEPIRAVHGGKVIYSNWLKGYGNIIVIDHGGNYHTVYAHAQELFKVRGDVVAAGEVVATVGDTGSLIGPDLYFEVRHHGKPIDPLKWIRKG